MVILRLGKIPKTEFGEKTLPSTKTIRMVGEDTALISGANMLKKNQKNDEWLS